MTNDGIWTRNNKFVILLRTGKIVPDDGKSLSLSMFPKPLKTILLQRRLTCEFFLSCHRSKRAAAIIVWIEAMKGSQTQGYLISQQRKQRVVRPIGGSFSEFFS